MTPETHNSPRKTVTNINTTLRLLRAIHNRCHAKSTPPQKRRVLDAKCRLWARFEIDQNLQSVLNIFMCALCCRKRGCSGQKLYLLRRMGARARSGRPIRTGQHTTHRELWRSLAQPIEMDIVGAGRRIADARIGQHRFATDQRVGGRRTATALLAAAEQRGHLEFVGRCGGAAVVVFVVCDFWGD